MEAIFDRSFTGETFKDGLPGSDFENCTFESCDFSGQNLSSFRFTDCNFSLCNFSGIRANDTAFRNASFKECKLLGFPAAYFRNIGLEMIFNKCNLQHSLFSGLKLPGTSFVDCDLSDSDFSEGTFSGSSFAKAILVNTKFDRTVLEKCDFRGAHGLVIDPSLNKLKNAHFEMQQLPGLVAHLGIKIS